MDTKEIVKLIKSDPESAFKYILSSNKEPIYWHIRKLVLNHEDANDLTQETFLKVWKNLSKFKGDSSVFTWLFRIATNTCYTFLEKEKKIKKESLENLEIQGEKEIQKSSIDTIKILLKALLTLPPKQRLVFNLKYFDNMKYSEISSLTNISEGGLKASYHLAVKKIESILNHFE